MADILHPQYGLARVLTTAAMQFARDNSIQLQQILEGKPLQKAAHSLRNAAWEELYVPDQYRCRAPKRIPAPVVALFRWLKSPEAASLISAIVRKRVHCKRFGLCAYAHGDYTLLHDKLKEPAGYDVIIDLTPHWDNRACGHHSYVDGNGNELVRVSAAFNTLTIVKRPANAMKFVKYVNHHAGKDKRFVLEARFT